MAVKKVFDSEGFAKAVLTKRVVDLKLKTREAAEQIGVSPATVSRIENENNPDIESFFRVCRWLGRSTDDFRVKENSAKPKK